MEGPLKKKNSSYHSCFSMEKYFFLHYIVTLGKIFFLPSGPKVPLLLPAPDREGCIFGLARQKNRIRTMGENKECLRSHVCHLHAIWDILLLLPRGVIYYFLRYIVILEKIATSERLIK